MFWGCWKGIFSRTLFFVGILVVIYGFILLWDNNNAGWTIAIVVGLIMSVGGSYLKYVSKKTVKPAKK